MIDINPNGIIQVSVLVTCVTVIPWLSVFTVLKLKLDHLL